MTTYNWEFGSLDAAVHFTISYDSAIGSFIVFCDKGSFNLGALWFSDGDSTKDFTTLLAKSDNSLNMNGTSTVWSDDGTTTQEKIVWDDYAKPLSPTLITEGSTVSISLSDIDQGQLESFITSLADHPEDFVLGVRSTSVNGTSDGFKWADTQPEIITNEVITNQAPVADTATANGAEDDESISITLSGSDSDGSIVSYTITSLPPQEQGILYTDTTLTTEVVVGQALTSATVYFVPAGNWSGNANFNYLVTDSNGANSSVAIASITVAPVSDAPTLSVVPASGDEDTAIALTINPALTDTDGSEILSVTISGIPAGASLSAGTLNLDGSVTLTPAQLTGLTITPPSNSDTDFTLTVTATATDGAAAPATTVDTILVTVNSVSDTPTLSVTPASGDEDTAIALTINPALTDTDGSEILSVTISGIPAGASLSAGTLNLDGSVTLTPAQLTGLTITPPSNSDTDFTLTVTATATDGAAAPATTVDTIFVTVNSVSDTPTLSVTPASGDEDTAIALTINPALTDTDGSEILSVTISNIPTGATLSNTGNDTLTISSGSITLTPDQLEGLTITPPNNSDADFTLTVTATATDGSAASTSVEETLAVTVNPVSDTPTLSVAPASGDEDTAIALTINPALTDTDGSETLSVTISNIPTGATLSNTGNDTLTISSGSITLTPAQLDGLAITPPENFYGNFALAITAISTDGLATPATTVDIINMTVNPVNDAPVAVADTLWVSESTTVKLPVSVLLGNDTDIDGKAITFQSIAESDSNITSVAFDSQTQTFTIVLANNAATTNGHAGTITDPGLATFTYTISDNASPALTSTGTVTVKIVATSAADNEIDISGQSYQGSYIDSASGADTLTGAASGDVFIGGAGNDVLNGSAGNDILRGGANDDILNGGAGMDLLDYSTVSTNFSFTLAADGSGSSIVQGQGTDTYSNMEGVIGGDGANTLTGNASDNVLIGGGGTDTLNGLDGNDILRGGTGNNDRMDGGTGTDLLDFSDGSIAISFTLQQGAAVGGGYYSITNGTAGLGDTDGYRNMEGVIGTNFDDTITGSSLNDVLMGGAGNDTLHGSDGNDTLISGAGADTLEGGSGSDSFTFLKGDAASVDTISDFTTGIGGDSLDISSVLSDSGVSTGTLADYVSVREYNGNTIVSVDADAGGVASAQDIAILTNVTGVTLEDLNLILPPNP